MLEIKSENGTDSTIEIKGDILLINGTEAHLDRVKLSTNKYHLLLNNRSVLVEFLGVEEGGKLMSMMIDGVKTQVKITNENDKLLAKLGLDKLTSSKLNQVKAPMPGLVLRIMVKEGDQVKKGEPLLVLEAMKMENVLKAPEDIVIRKIEVSERTAVEKNQVLLTLG